MNGDNYKMNSFILNHKIQLQSIEFPEILYEQLYDKLSQSIFDGGNYVQFIEPIDFNGNYNNKDFIDDDQEDRDNDDDVGSEIDAKTSDSDSNNSFRESINDSISFPDISYHLQAIDDIKSHSTVILIDHMWTTTFPQARYQLQSYKSLQSRIEKILGLTNADNEQNIDNVWDRIWPHLGGYLLPNTLYTQWYLMDEVGLSIQHSNQPNMKCYPLVVKLDDGPPFVLSIAWPIVDITTGDNITRDYLPNYLDDSLRKLYSLGYLYPNDLTNHLSNGLVHKLTLKDKSFHNIDENQSFSYENLSIKSPEWNNSNIIKLKVYCDRSDHLDSHHVTGSQTIELTSDYTTADVLYLIDYSTSYNLTNKVTNQFIWNDLIITKDQLISTVTIGYNYLHQSHPNWFPKSFDVSISTDMTSFIEFFLNDPSNLFICKKFNSKQGLDYPITNILSCIIKYIEMNYNVISKYILYPCLLQHRKFDLRFYVIIKSLDPLVIYRHSQFVIRWANHHYTTSDYEDYQTHFTVMNFLNNQSDGNTDSSLGDIRGIGKRDNLSIHRFIDLFDSERSINNEEITWNDVQIRIDNVIKQLFECVSVVYYNKLSAKTASDRTHPNTAWSEDGYNKSPARAMYGVDIILDSSYNPFLLEVQWAPDCDKTLELYPTFWNDILSCLYLDKSDNILPIT